MVPVWQRTSLFDIRARRRPRGTKHNPANSRPRLLSKTASSVAPEAVGVILLRSPHLSYVSDYRINFDLHRAVGLWTWVMLLVLAVSSVQYNLYDEIFRPTLTALLPSTTH
jgi:hypothetical protein